MTPRQSRVVLVLDDDQPLIEPCASRVMEGLGIKTPGPATPQATWPAGGHNFKAAPSDDDAALSGPVRDMCSTLESKFGALLDHRLDNVSTTEPASPASCTSSIGAAQRDPASQPLSPAATSTIPVIPPELGGMPLTLKLEQAIQDAVKEDGKFGMRGTALGYQWGVAMKQSPALAGEYAEQKGYVAQREFRARWVSRLWNVINEKRSKKEQIVEMDRSDAIFYPIQKWITEDGGGEEAAEGVQHFLKKVRMHT